MDLIRRVSRFSGMKLLAYGVMSNHFYVFVYIGYPEIQVRVKLDGSLVSRSFLRRLKTFYDAHHICARRISK